MRFNDVIISKETGGKTHNNDSWDFFSEDTFNVNLVPVRLTSEEVDNLDGDTAVNSPVVTPLVDDVEVFPEEAESQLESPIQEVETLDDEPIPQPRASRNRDRVNYRELHGIRQYAKRGFILRASKAKLDNMPTVPLTI